MNLDNELRALLSERAELAPEDAGLLDAVRVRSHRLVVRRRYGLAVLAGLLVLGLLIPAGLLRYDRRDTPLPPGRPSATPSVSSPPTPGGIPVTLVAGAPALPDFPFVLGWTPAGTQFTVGLGGTERRMVDEGSGLGIVVDGAEYQWDWEADTTTSTTVNGRAARLRSATIDGKQPVGLTWQLADGRWLTVDSWGGNIPQADVLRLARAIRAGVTPATPLPFTLALTPAGFVLTDVDPNGLCLAPPTWTLSRGATGLCVWLYPPSSPDDLPETQPKTLGGHAGKWVHHPGQFQFWARLPDGRLLVLLADTDTLSSQAPQVVPWLDISDADLDRFVAGITPTP